MWEKIKPYILWIITPLVALIYYISYLKRTIDDLRAGAARAKLNDEIKETLHAKEQAGKEADKLESDFIRLRDEYRDSRKGGLPDDSGEV